MKDKQPGEGSSKSGTGKGGGKNLPCNKKKNEEPEKAIREGGGGGE
jgi:hypothetical protein